MLKSEHFSKHYPVKPLGDVVDFLDNLRKPVKSSNRIEGEYLYYGANGVQGSIDQYIFDEPLVLLAEDGGHFGNPEKTIAYIARGKYWVNNHAHVLKPKECIDLNFLCRVLEKYDVTPFIKGATRAKLTKGDALTIPIPVPPLPEQKRIAAILDKSDSLRRKNQQAIQLADQFLRAVFLDMFGDPVTNPKGWKRCKFEDLIEMVTYGLTVRPEYHNEGFPLISAREIRNGFIDVANAPKISEEDFYRLPEKARPKLNDILFSKTGSIGHCAIVDSRNEFAVTQNAARIVPNTEKCEPLFLLSLLRTKYFFDLANREAKGNAVKDLQLGVMKDFSVYAPPIETQREFVAIFKCFERLKASNIKTQQKGNNLFYCVSQKAFSGEL